MTFEDYAGARLIAGCLNPARRHVEAPLLPAELPARPAVVAADAELASVRRMAEALAPQAGAVVVDAGRRRGSVGFLPIALSIVAANLGAVAFVGWRMGMLG